MASELKPCLLCEGEAKLLRRSGTAGRACPSKWYRERVECKVCGLTTREYKKPGAAAHSWNTRPAPAATDTGLVTVPPMPETVDRRPYDDDKPDGYLESNRDWADNNNEAVEWFADNHAAIREALRTRSLAEELLAAKDARIDRLVDNYANLVKETVDQTELIADLEDRLAAAEKALTEIASFTQTTDLLWWQERARAALGGKSS